MSTSTAYPPSPSGAGSRPPFHNPQSHSTSSLYSSSLPGRSAGGTHQPHGQPFKPMYDLPPGFHPPQPARTGSAGSGSVPQHRSGAAGGLNRLRSPPLVPGGSSQASSPGSKLRSSPSKTPPLYQPQPRRTPVNPPSLLDTTTSPPPGTSVRSSTTGKPASIFSNGPQNTSSPSTNDIALFSEHCRRVFFDNDPRSAQYVDQVFRSIPLSHKAAFIREQSRVRQTFHRAESVRRRMEFEALLASTTSGGALTVKARRDPRGSVAKKERRERLKRFLDTHTGKNNVGPAPLLTSLAAVLRLQAQAAKKGGAGAARIEWEVDDAVWMEAGGKDFLIDALAVVKGVLGFEDIPRPRPRRRSDGASNVLRSPLAPPFYPSPSNHSPPSTDNHSTPNLENAPFLPPPALPPASAGGSRRGKAPPPPAQSASYSSSSSSADSRRPRAGSDPFSDAPRSAGVAGRPPMLPSPLSGGGGGGRRGPAPPIPSRTPDHPGRIVTHGEELDPLQPPPSKDRTFSHGSSVSQMEPLTPGTDDGRFLLASNSALLIDDEYDEEDGADGVSISPSEEDESMGDLTCPRWRTWVAPAGLTNPELCALVRLFPGHLGKKSKGGRFPYVGPGQGMLEEGGGLKVERDGRTEGRGVVECLTAWSGTGRVWVGAKEREAGWRGTGWERFCEWWRSLFS